MDLISPLPQQAGNSLEQRLLREGWSLHARLQLAAEITSAVPDVEMQGMEVPSSHKQQLATWRQLVAPDHPANFEKRLQWDGLTPSAVACALDPPVDLVPQSPNWLPQLQMMRQAARDAARTNLPHPLHLRGCQLPFVHVWYPAVVSALQELQHRCADLKSRTELSEIAWLDLANSLLERLCSTAGHALWELFNQRRTPGQILLAHLAESGDGQGAPVSEAYDQFVQEVLADGYSLLLQPYPVLGRILAVVVQLWLEGSEEMLRHIAASRAALATHFDIREAAPLERIQLGLSDAHRGGRGVAVLRFGSQSDSRQVVYKPRDMNIDRSYQEFLNQINGASELPPLRSLKVLTGMGYGFIEWVEHRICENDTDLARFYTNSGRLMAILYLLGCTDCHYENLIASGDQLVLIDTETLLQADVRDFNSDDGEDSNTLSPLQLSIQSSVLRSGMLPHWVMSGAGRKRGFDISALGIQPPPAEREIPGWLGVNSDSMMPGLSQIPCELPNSLPVGLGSPQRLTDFIEQLCSGFAQQMQVILHLRTQVLTMLGGFVGQPCRLVARATRLYFTIQRQMLAPASLCSAVEQGLKLEQLSRTYLLSSEKPLNWQMFAAEIRQMEQFDIPFFEHPIDSDELPLPEGLAPIEGFMTTSGLAAARRRLQALEAKEIDFQLQLIRGAIAARGLRSFSASAPIHIENEPTIPKTTASANGDDFRREAHRLAEEIWYRAIRDHKGRPEWLGLDLAADGQSFSFGLVGPSLYSGSSGIAVLFARLARYQDTRNQDQASCQWQQRAWSCVETIAEISDSKSSNKVFRLIRDLPYGISGSGGILLALTLLHNAGMRQAAALASKLVAQLNPETLAMDEGLDVICGVSGLIGPLLTLGTPRALDLAVVCGERLLLTQLESGGWPSGSIFRRSHRPALTGFSHGASGMAAALARLAQNTGEERFAAGVEKAIAYERSVYVKERGNWPDFRSNIEPNNFMHTWCHGAPGILISRLVLQAAGWNDLETGRDLHMATASTAAALERAELALGGAAHLCCGVLGLTSLLRMAGYHTSLPLRVEARLIQQASQSGQYPLLAVDTGTLNLPGLFTGHAGVALALLEAADGLQWLPTVLSAGLLEVAPTMQLN